MKFEKSIAPLSLVDKGGELRSSLSKRKGDPTLIRALAKAHFWQSLIDSGKADSGSAIAKAEGIDPSVINEILRLTLLAPDLIDSIINGQQPKNLSLVWFQRNPMPLDWQEQRDLMVEFRNKLFH
jgi:hypothetical protein